MVSRGENRLRSLAVIASSVPYTPNLSRIRQELHIIDQRTLLKYLYYLNQAEMITVLTREAKGNQILRKPDKIYLNNPNLLWCFNNAPETGTGQTIPLWLFGFLY